MNRFIVFNTSARHIKFTAACNIHTAAAYRRIAGNGSTGHIELTAGSFNMYAAAGRCCRISAYFRISGHRKFRTVYKYAAAVFT